MLRPNSIKICQNSNFMSKIWNAITGDSGLLCYFMPLTEIAQTGAKKRSGTQGTKHLSLTPIFDKEVDVTQAAGIFSPGFIGAITDVSFSNPFKMSKERRNLRPARLAAALLGLLSCLVVPAQGQGTQPVVAIHDSELTRALDSTNAPAFGATPTGPGTTGNQWWITQWHYFVMPDAVKEALRSDGTAFTVVGDSNILAGVLTNADGTPKYPILISLASEAIDDGEIARLTNYVAAGGFLFVGSSSFTRNTNGTSRGDFAIASAMGVDMVDPALTNWSLDGKFTKISNHPILSLLPSVQIEWQMPSSSEEISPYSADSPLGNCAVSARTVQRRCTPIASSPKREFLPDGRRCPLVIFLSGQGVSNLHSALTLHHAFSGPARSGLDVG